MGTPGWGEGSSPPTPGDNNTRVVHVRDAHSKDPSMDKDDKVDIFLAHFLFLSKNPLHIVTIATVAISSFLGIATEITRKLRELQAATHAGNYSKLVLNNTVRGGDIVFL